MSSNIIKGIKKERYTIAHFFGASQYVRKDTSTLLHFQGSAPLPKGVYLLLNEQKKKVLEFVITDSQQIEFESDTSDIIGKLSIKGSKDNLIYADFQKNIKAYNDEVNILKLQERVSGVSMLFKPKIENANRKLSVSVNDLIAKNPQSLVSKYLSANNDVVVPDVPKNIDTKKDSTWQYRYYKSHYWDNIDFGEESLVRTPFLQRRIDRYMQTVSNQIADSVKVSADRLIGKAIDGKQKEILAYCIWYLTNKYENPELYGSEDVFVHLAEKYYVGGIMPITDSLTITNIKGKVNVLKPLLVGKKFPELTMADTLGRPVPLYSLNSNYTVVVLYDPLCKHCRLATPELKAAQDSLKTKNVVFYALAITGSPQNWKAYIKEFGIESWTHTFDATMRTDYRTQFDVQKTPMIYILDKEKNIIARRLEASMVLPFLQYQFVGK